MKKALFKDTLTEIKRSMGRFLSIFAIIALGCGFFAGIKATMPDMVDTAETYFEDHQLMDMKLVSTIGVQSEDVTAVRRAENVESAAAGYSKDVFYYYNNQNLILKVMSVPKSGMNEAVLLEGRLPEKKGECAVEVKMNSPDTFKVGGRLKLTVPEGEDILGTLSTDSYEIVGIITSPMYIGFERDRSLIGTGEVSNYIMVPEEDFVLDRYTELYVRFKGLREYDQFSEEYSDAVSLASRDAVKVFHESVTARYDRLKADAEKKLADAETELMSFESLLTLSAEDLAAVYKTASAEYQAGKKSYDAMENKGTAAAFLAEAKLAQVKKQLDMLSELVSGGDAAREKYMQLYRSSKQELEDGREQLEKIPELKFYDTDRFSLTDYAGFENDAMKVDSIAKVFPAFFILIAALVTLTTMTRMIDEQRTTIGTYKALGYSAGQIIFKYLFYAFLASAAGSVLGTVIGLQVFPSIIYQSYKMMYNIPQLDTPFRPLYLAGCMAASLLCTGGAVLYASLKTLRSQPSALMRPKPPASGRRVLLERVGFIWKKMSFLMKVTVRNLLRYKKRFFMTVAGVAGCTALIITGFGLKHSIKSIAERQFNDVFLYDAVAVMDTDSGAVPQKAKETLLGTDGVEDVMLFSSVSCETRKGTVNQNVSLVCPERPESFGGFISLEKKDGSGSADLGNGKAAVTEKLAKLMKLSEGSSITLSLPDGDTAEFEIGAVVKNYTMHYVYVSPELYKEKVGSEPVYKSAYMKLGEVNEDGFKEAVIGDRQFLGLSFKGGISANFLKSVDSLDSITLLLIFCAGLLAVIVLYDLANINITERVREIATIKVLGFFDGETSAYIYRENIISTLLGIGVGIGLGRLLHYFVVMTAEIDIVLFNHELIWWAYLFGVLLTIGFAMAVNIVLHFKLRRIDMVESLKSIE